MDMHTTSLTPSTHPRSPAPAPRRSSISGRSPHNVRVLREHAGPAAGDGGGQGRRLRARRLAGRRAALAAGAAELGVATIDEALALRGGGITAPVLSWLHPPGTDFAPALAADIQLAVSSARQVADLLARSSAPARTAEVTVKVDTGLNRNGVSPADFPPCSTALQRAAAADAIRMRGIMSHLANGDAPDDPLNDLQAQRLTAADRRARDRGIEFEVAHLSNSPSAMTRPDLGFDMVRPGIAVYGLSPIPERGDMGLRPAMTLKCTVAMVKPVQGGRGRVLRAHLDRGARHQPGAAADRLCRRGVPRARAAGSTR